MSSANAIILDPLEIPASHVATHARKKRGPRTGPWRTSDNTANGCKETTL